MQAMIWSFKSGNGKQRPYSAFRPSRAAVLRKRSLEANQYFNPRRKAKRNLILRSYLTNGDTSKILLLLNLFQYNNIIETMSIAQTVELMMGYVNRQPHAGPWYVGTRAQRRIHPYDEQHLSFSTCGWVSYDMEKPDDAAAVVRELISRGAAKLHFPAKSNGANVFAYLIKDNSTHNESLDHD